MSLQAVVEEIASEPTAKEFFSHPASAQSLYCPAGLRPALIAAAAQTNATTGKFSPLFSSMQKLPEASQSKQITPGLSLIHI